MVGVVIGDGMYCKNFRMVGGRERERKRERERERMRGFVFV